ncbi:hypothetical protein TSOC111612_23360 [Tsukamurella ocularis]
MRPATIGSMRKPAFVGLAPRTTWKYWGSSEIPPNMAAPTTIEMRTPCAKMTFVKIRSGMIASSPMYFSMAMNARTPTAPMA